MTHEIAEVWFWGKKESMKSGYARFPPFIHRDMILPG